MYSVKDTALKNNPYLKINFDGGDLSSDSELLLIKEFAEKIGLVQLVYQLFQTNDSATFRIHIDPENLLQMIYQIICFPESSLKIIRLPLPALLLTLFYVFPGGVKLFL